MLSLASSEELGRKTPATESSIAFRLCLLCQGDKCSLTSKGSSCDNQHWNRTNKWQPFVDCIQNSVQYQMYIQCGINHVMNGKATVHTNNIWRGKTLDMAKRFYPMSRVYCFSTRRRTAPKFGMHVRRDTLTLKK